MFKKSFLPQYRVWVIGVGGARGRQTIVIVPGENNGSLNKSMAVGIKREVQIQEICI